MVRYGGEKKVYVSKSAKKFYDKITGKENIFPHIQDLFHFGAALGIRLHERKKIDKKTELLNVYSIDNLEIFEAVIDELHPNEDGKTRLKLLQEYAEGGISILKDRYEDDKDLDIREILKDIGAIEAQ